MSSLIATRPRTGIPGLLVLVGIVVIGVTSGAAYFHYKAPRLKKALDEKLAAAPKTAAGRLAAYHVYGEPNIHHRLSVVGRFSEERPWLVTHALDVGEGQLELWGIDCESIPHGVSTVEGMTVFVDLPAPYALGRIPRDGQFTSYVPVYSSAADVPDPAARLTTVATHLLEGMPAALARDIEGATIEFRIAAP